MKEIINGYTYNYSSTTSVGKVRLVNEDRVLIVKNDNNDFLIIVADGMGGHNRGDYASKLAVDFISDAFKSKRRPFSSIIGAKIWLQSIVSKANKLLFDTSEKNIDCKGMGTTLVVALIRNGNAIILNVGDSAAYTYFDSKLNKISIDQSYVEYMKQSGQMSEEEAEKSPKKNILLNALGIYPSTSFTSKIIQIKDEAILLCSDGLTNNLKVHDIINIINKNVDAENITNELVNAANDNGGTDNISVAYFERKKNDKNR